MDFTLSEERRLILETAKNLAENEFAEDAMTWEDEYPWEHMQTLAAHDLLSITLPEEYGGADGTALDVLCAMEGVGTVCPQTAGHIMHGSFGPGRAINKWGSERHKERYLPPLTRGESKLGIAISEPQAGSDASAMQTTAQRDGDAYVINGHKTWISHAEVADAFLTYVEFPDGNIGCIILEPAMDGFEVGESYQCMNGSEHAELYFDDLRVDESQVLLHGAESFKDLMKFYNLERIGGCMKVWIAAKWAFNDALDYAKQREQFGQPIADFQVIRHKFADMATLLDAGRYFIYRVAAKAEPDGDGELPTKLESSMAKAFVGDIVNEVADQALQVHAANGYIGESPVDWIYRYVRYTRIAGGTAEIQRNMIADEIFELGDIPEF